ncbi:hypothetical protein Ddc_22925 [Ditylenchus destructor]|nr:hypothetical protein Ddc_22925 [Ditylenchus destructor]
MDSESDVGFRFTREVHELSFFGHTYRFFEESSWLRFDETAASFCPSVRFDSTIRLARAHNFDLGGPIMKMFYFPIPSRGELSLTPHSAMEAFLIVRNKFARVDGQTTAL